MDSMQRAWTRPQPMTAGRRKTRILRWTAACAASPLSLCNRARRSGSCVLFVHAVCAWLTCAALPQPSAAQTDDYGVASPAWNSLSGLVALGRDPSRGTTFELPSVLDLHELRPNDALLLVFPTKSPPREDLSAFLHAGGRLAIADDFGESAA